MNTKTFNLGASIGAFALGTIYLFSDSASITANVIGSSGNSTGLASIMGMMLILGSIGLFVVSIRSTDNHSIDLERLIRATKHHEVLRTENPETEEETKYMEYHGENEEKA